MLTSCAGKAPECFYLLLLKVHHFKVFRILQQDSDHDFFLYRMILPIL